MRAAPVANKLAVVYLIDSILKNAQGAYVGLFAGRITSTFCGVFRAVGLKTRKQLEQVWVAPCAAATVATNQNAAVLPWSWSGRQSFARSVVVPCCTPNHARRRMRLPP